MGNKSGDAHVTSKDLVSAVREAYGQTLDRDAHGVGHYEDCWKDHYPCLIELLLSEIGAQGAARMTDTSRTSNEHAIDIGRELARRLFAKRGNHSEAHLSELDLAAICALAAERALAIPAAETTDARVENLTPEQKRESLQAMYDDLVGGNSGD